jgi:hypothetical protein
VIKILFIYFFGSFFQLNVIKSKSFILGTHPQRFGSCKCRTTIRGEEANDPMGKKPKKSQRSGSMTFSFLFFFFKKKISKAAL